MFGKGVYFAESSTKADQYVGKADVILVYVHVEVLTSIVIKQLFLMAASATCNQLPSNIHSSGSISTYREHLQFLLYDHAFSCLHLT